MAKFIEVHKKSPIGDEAFPVLQNLDDVSGVYHSNDGGAGILLRSAAPAVGVGVFAVTETYAQLRLMIGAAQGGIPMEEIELKPCPFCGGKAEYKIDKSYKWGTTRGWQFGIKCTNCMMELPMRDFVVTVDLESNGEIAFDKDDRKKAADMWNRRAEHE